MGGGTRDRHQGSGSGMGESTRETSQGLKGGNSDMPQAPGQIHLGETIVFCELPQGEALPRMTWKGWVFLENLFQENKNEHLRLRGQVSPQTTFSCSFLCLIIRPNTQPYISLHISGKTTQIPKDIV